MRRRYAEFRIRSCKMEKWKKKIAKWGDEWKMALLGVARASRNWKFWLGFILIALLFGTLMHLLSVGLTNMQILFSGADFSFKMTILREAFLQNFGIGINFWDFLPIFLISLLEGVLITMIVLTSGIKKQSRRLTKEASETAESGKISAIAAGLAVLGTGCPTCGTSLLIPVLGSVFAGSSAAIGAISGILTAVAVIVALFALKKIGVEYFALSTMVKRLNKKLRA